MRPKLSYANVVSTLCLFLVLGGASYAAFKLPKNSVGSRQIKNGSITPNKLSAAAKQALKGEIGPVGPQGPKGDPGLPATKLWAVVNEEGHLVRGSGAVSVEHDRTGVFTVIFNQDIKSCAYLASPVTTVAKNGGLEWPEPGETAVAPLLNNANGVVVTRAFHEGEEGDELAFSLAVFC